MTLNQTKETDDDETPRKREDKETQDFYKRWKGILTNQLSLETETDVAGKLVLTDDQDKTVETSSLDLKRNYENFFSNQTKKRPQRPSKGAPMSYSYANLKRVLDPKFHSNVSEPALRSGRREIMSKSMDARNKASIVFQEHAQWLQNMKMQVITSFFEFIRS